MKGRWHEPVGFLLFFWRNVPCSYTLPAVRAIDRAMVQGKINAAVNNAVVEHLNQIGLADFLVMGYETSTISACYTQNMAAFYFSAIGVLDNHHNASPDWRPLGSRFWGCRASTPILYHLHALDST